MRKEPTTSRTLPLGRLTSKIHPLFRKQRFFPSEEFEFNFEVLEQSARLASRLLECGVLENFFHAILIADVWRNPDNQRDWGVGYDHQPQPPSPSGKESIEDILDEFSINMIWCMMDTLDTAAVTNQLGDAEVELPECPHGYKGVVQISKRTYDALAKAHEEAEDLPLLITLQFKFAVMLVHEIAHVAHNFRYGKIDREPSLNDKGVCELGFDLESHLFGGHLTRLYDHIDEAGESTERLHRHEGRKSKLAGMIVLWDWPYQALIRKYQDSKSYIEVHQDNKMNNPVDMAWRVSITFLPHFFKDDF